MFGRGEPTVARHDRGLQRLGESHVCSVVGGERIAQFPNSRDERMVRVADHRHDLEIEQRLFRSREWNQRRADSTAERVRHFHIEEVRHMNRPPSREQPQLDARADPSSKEQFQCRRGVENNHRESRSARMSSAADTGS